jgi:transcriptional regulator with XRE-family HTH domain
MIAGMADAPIGKRIRLRRQALKWTQQQLADKLHVNRATVSAWERGKQLPERNEGAIEAALGISLAENGTPWYDSEDPVERGIAEDPSLSGPDKRAFVAQLRARRMKHPQAQEPPA